MNPDFRLVALLANAVAVVDVGILVARGFVNGLCKHKRSAAGCVNLLIVVLFDDFNIVLLTQNRYRLLGKLTHKIYAYRHICSEEYRYLTRRRLDFCGLFIAVAGGSKYQGGAVGLSVFQKTVKSGGVGEVDNNIRLAGELRWL